MAVPAAVTGAPDEGQAAVELALTLPILLLCAALIFSLSLVGVSRLAVEHAASEAARALALTNDEERARQTAQGAAGALRRDRLEIEISPRLAAERPRGTLASVTVRYRLALPLGIGPLREVEVTGFAARRMEHVP